MNGRFFIGVLSGAVLITGAFVVGSVMFPVDDAMTPAEVANRAQAPSQAPGTEAGAPLAGGEAASDLQLAEADMAPEAAPEPVPEAAPEPAPAAEPVPEAEPAPEAEPEPAPEPAPEIAPELAPKPEVAKAAEALVNDTPAAADAPAAAVSEGVTTGGTAATEAVGDQAGAEALPSDTVPAADPSPASEPAPQGAGETPPAAEAMAEPPTEPPVEPPVAEPAEAAVEPAPTAPAPAEAAPQPEPPAAPELPEADLPVPGGTDAPEAPAPEAPTPEAVVPEAVVPEPAETTPDPLPDAAATPEAKTAEAPAEAPKSGAEPPAEEALPQADGMAPGTALPADQPTGEAAPQPTPEVEDPAPGTRLLPEGPADAPTDSTFTPTPGLGDKSEGVVVGRLPRIGDAPAAEGLPAEPAEPVPDVEARPIDTFATKFDNPDAKPLVALVLIDPGTAELDRAGLAALPFPVSFALDPLDPATPERAAIYRAAGREVVMLATGIAEGAQASDIEVAFQSMAQGLPEAVAVMDLAEPVFQDRRPLASIVVPVIGAQGRGLLTWDQGLNAADQVARREDVAAAVVFRDLASGGPDSEAVRRVLDRAVFKAAQDGRVAVAGTATPELVAALLEWTIEGKAATVALAPLTAVLTVE